jgi:hypothetical protein
MAKKSYGSKDLSYDPTTGDSWGDKEATSPAETTNPPEDQALRLQCMDQAIAYSTGRGGVDPVVIAEQIYQWVITPPPPPVPPVVPDEEAEPKPAEE